MYFEKHYTHGGLQFILNLYFLHSITMCHPDVFLRENIGYLYIKYKNPYTFELYKQHD